jgi:hypothetical protein
MAWAHGIGFLTLVLTLCFPRLQGKQKYSCSITEKHFPDDFLLPTLQLASATFFPSQNLNKVLKIDMMQCNTASCLSMARLSWRGNTALCMP